MYEAHFGLSGPPFLLNPDTSFFYESRGHGEALAYLRYGIAQRQGFVVLTGEIGAGKTTLVKTLLERIDASVVAAHVVSSQLESTDLIRAMLRSFGAPAAGIDKAELADELARLLSRLDAEGRSALLIVDEAQNLDVETLEDLRLLSNLHEGPRAVLQIVLVGQPELRGRLHAPELAQLRQRVFASCHLGPLDPEEAMGYVEHRLRRVGWSGVPGISPQAHARIYAGTGGLPRRINRLCNRLLVAAYLSEHREITPKLVDDTTHALHAEVGDAVEAPAGRPLEIAAGPSQLMRHLRTAGAFSAAVAAPPAAAGDAPGAAPADEPAAARHGGAPAAPQRESSAEPEHEPAAARADEPVAAPAPPLVMAEPDTPATAAPVTTPSPLPMAMPLRFEPPAAHPVSVFRIDAAPARRPSRHRWLAAAATLAAVAIGGALLWPASPRPSAVALDRLPPTAAGPAAVPPAAEPVAPAPQPAPTTAATGDGTAAATTAALALDAPAPAAAALASAPDDGHAVPPAAKVDAPAAAVPPPAPVAARPAPAPRPMAAARTAPAPRAPAPSANPLPAAAAPAAERPPRAYPGPCTDTIAALGLCAPAASKEY